MKAIGLAIIVLLAVIALQLNGIQQQGLDQSPGSYSVVRCPNGMGWCDDPSTTD